MVGGFFFSSRRRHTRFTSDWSSDVCSSDLFESGTADLLIDQLLIGSASSSIDSIELNDNRLGLLNQDSIYTKLEIKVIGQNDNNGNPVPSKFLSTDEMRLNIYSRIQYFIDGADVLDSD